MKKTCELKWGTFARAWRWFLSGIKWSATWEVPTVLWITDFEMYDSNRECRLNNLKDVTIGEIERAVGL